MPLPTSSALPPVLSTQNHDRDAMGMVYVYPVVSRRAGGVSIGINLNPNNACNWRCIYCQVPNLSRGGPPPLNLVQLETELRGLLTDVVHGDFMSRVVPEGMRRLNDVAFSGNGEPTSAAEFAAVVQRVGQVLTDFGLAGKIKQVLITNGSLAHRPVVQAGIRLMAELNGEVWFKFDRATAFGLSTVNDTPVDPEQHYQRLKRISQICTTWVQTCLFAVDGRAPEPEEVEAYIAMLSRAKAEKLPLAGVLLYGLARASTQPEASKLNTLPEKWLKDLARRIEALGLKVRLTP